MKIIERLCLVLWAVITTAAVSCFGLGVMIFSINIGARYLGEGEQLVMESHMLMFAGLATMAPAMFTRYFGVKYLHFLEHDDGISHDDEL